MFIHSYLKCKVAHPFYHLVAAADFVPYYGHPFENYMLAPSLGKRKGGQVRFTPDQTQHLECKFKNQKYLSPDERRKLASQLKLTDQQVIAHSIAFN